MFENKTDWELEELKRQIDEQIEKRKNGKTYPVYVISQGDTNECFKFVDGIKNYIKNTLITDIYSDMERISIFVREISEIEYNEKSDSWLEV